MTLPCSRLPRAAALLLLLASISCSGFQHGYSAADYAGHWWPVITDDPRDPSGFRRLELETAFDSTLTEFVAAHGSPDFIHVIDMDSVELLYFREDAIYFFTRATLSSESSLQQTSPISAARGDRTGFVPRPSGPPIPGPATHTAPAATSAMPAALTAAAAGSASAQRRVALVIGNANYADAPLRNPTHDAEDMARVLASLHFTVITRTNINQREMEDAVQEFFRAMEHHDVALFYFSGHGTQVQGENYLIPVRENIQSESDVRYKAVNAGYVLGKMEESGRGTNIVILDACRNNPFKSFRSQNRGLVVMSAPRGSFVAYATAPGSVAHDGTGRNGTYTRHLLEAVQMKGTPIEQVFKQVVVDVEQETANQQTPWTSSSLRDDFYFNP